MLTSDLVSTSLRAELEVPTWLKANRQPGLERVLAGLPDHLLSALVRGLERYGDDLAPGTLFSSPNSCCAVGAMIRELHPEEFRGGKLRFLLRHRWRRGADSYGGALASSHVGHLEALFDRLVRETMGHYPGVGEAAAARAVGAWIHRLAERELAWRRNPTEPEPLTSERSLPREKGVVVGPF
jgi:hypothetical protein